MTAAATESGDCFCPTPRERAAVERVLLSIRQRWSDDRRTFDRDPYGTADRLLGQLVPAAGDRRQHLIDHVVSRAMDARQSELWEVSNRSRWKIILPESCDCDGRPDDLVLAPLERRITNVHPRHLYPIRVLVRHQFLGVRPYRPARTDSWKVAASIGTALPIALGVAALVWGGLFRSWLVVAGTLGLAMACALGAAYWAARSTASDHHALDSGPGDPGDYRDSFAAPPSASDAAVWMAERATYLVMLGITVVGPALAVYHGTDLSTYLRFAPSGAKVVQPPGITRDVVLHQVVGRALQLVYCSVVSMLPALLYFMFDRQRLSSLRESWIRHLFHLNPHVWTVSEIEAAYGSRLDEALGGGGMSSRLVGGRRLPIVVATILITLGWTLMLLDTKVNGPGAGDEPYLDLLMPEPTLAGMAFLGTYFFTLQFILRSFIRGDLRPKSYSTIAVRVVAGVTVAYLVGIVVPKTANNGWLLVAAFFAGYVPDTVLRRIANLAKVPPLAGLAAAVTSEMDGNERDLNLIAGMDIYAKTKLFSEGITNVESLAHTDPIDLMVRTRFPAGELIEWIDQALLLLHAPASAVAPLATRGIRTATSLNTLCGAPQPGQPSPPCEQRAALEPLFPAGTLDTVLRNLGREPVLLNLLAWRESTRVGLGQELPGCITDPRWDKPYVDDSAIRSVSGRFDIRRRPRPAPVRTVSG